MSNVEVSVLCITYNQEDYIEETIKSFLMQITTFDYEILIHDDASTDGTSKIVRKYAELYPDKIKAIIQTENQYSKKKSVVPIIASIAKGKYYALCEGDDYWTDRNKLQKQYEYMEKNSSCSLCIHDSYILYNDNIVFYPKRLAKQECEFNIEDAIMGLGIRMATNCAFYRAEAYNSDDKYVELAPAGDYIRPIRAALMGSIHYIPERMCVHRMLAKNSFSSTMGTGEKSSKRWDEFYQRLYEALEEFNRVTDLQYLDIVKKSFIQQRFSNYLSTNNYKMIKQEPYSELYKKLSIKKKLEFKLPLLNTLAKKVYYQILKVKFTLKPEKKIIIDYFEEDKNI